MEIESNCESKGRNHLFEEKKSGSASQNYKPRILPTDFFKIRIVKSVPILAISDAT